MESPSPVWARPAYSVRHYHYFSNSGPHSALILLITRTVFYEEDSKTVFCMIDMMITKYQSRKVVKVLNKTKIHYIELRTDM